MGRLNVDRLTEAVATANFALLPHIRRFCSLSGLLSHLAALSGKDLEATADSMLRSAAEAWEVTAEFYRRVATYLLGIRVEHTPTPSVEGRAREEKTLGGGACS